MILPSPHLIEPDFQIRPLLPHLGTLSVKLINRDGETNKHFDQKFEISDSSLSIQHLYSQRVEICFEVVSRSFMVGDYYTFVEIGGRRYSQVIVERPSLTLVRSSFWVKKGTRLRLLACTESKPH